MLNKFEYKQGTIEWDDRYREVRIYEDFDEHQICIDPATAGSLIGALQRVDKIWQERKPYLGGEDEE